MKRVIIESPYAGDIERNKQYARRAMKHSLAKHESPFLSHMLYTQEGVLDDADPDQRALGITAGFQWHKCAELVAVYCDYGISPGMALGIKNARKIGIPLEFRVINENGIDDLIKIIDEVAEIGKEEGEIRWTKDQFKNFWNHSSRIDMASVFRRLQRMLSI